jgi:hydrogenase nickel incorporation protein HypB
MCDKCGCEIKNDKCRENSKESMDVLQNLLHENEHMAAHNKEHFDSHGVLAINIMSSPGSGKTCLLEATIDALKDRYRIGVIEGDLETENDAARIKAKGVPAVQITTGTSCHLDAAMVHKALHEIDLDEVDILFIENVGNLVCPAAFDLGQHYNVVMLSVTEGDDKPAKYPVMFRAADMVTISKTDLLEVLGDFDPDKVKGHIKSLANPAPVIQVSAKKIESLQAWFSWIEGKVTGSLKAR